MISIFSDSINIFQPFVTLMLSIIVPLFIRKIMTPITKLLKLTEESKQLEIESMLRNSLHNAASNGIKFAMSRLQSNTITPEILKLAGEYINKNNHETIKSLNVNDKTIEEILHSKSPIFNNNDDNKYASNNNGGHNISLV